MMTVFGIPNCSTVKKARQWLADHHIDYQFHDLKKQGVTEQDLQSWLQTIPLDTLINRRGTTWRQLTEAEKRQAQTRDTAITLMQQKPTVIRRPILVRQDDVLVGFAEGEWAALLL